MLYKYFLSSPPSNCSRIRTHVLPLSSLHRRPGWNRFHAEVRQRQRPEGAESRAEWSAQVLIGSDRRPPPSSLKNLLIRQLQKDKNNISFNFPITLLKGNYLQSSVDCFYKGPSFLFLFSSFQKNITIFTTNRCEKCPVLGFEHMTFGTWVSSHNH